MWEDVVLRLLLWGKETIGPWETTLFPSPISFQTRLIPPLPHFPYYKIHSPEEDPVKTV